MNYKIIIFVSLFIYSPQILSCKMISGRAADDRDNKFPTIFIGKVTERAVEKTALEGIKKIKLKILPLKVKKGIISTKQYYWFPSNNESLKFIVGDLALVYADKNNEIQFGEWCYPLSASLGIISNSDLDKYWNAKLEIENPSL